MPNKTNYHEPMHCLAGSLLWQEILGVQCFCQKKCSCKQSELFFLKKYSLSPCPKRIRPLIKPFLIKEQISKAPGHERVQFTLVGLFSGFTIAAIFSTADPGAKKVKPFTKAIAKFKVQAFKKNQTNY